MRKFLFFFFFIQWAFGADFDCVFIGSSPIPLFEAIYQHSLGKKVVIVEQASEPGGAWKSINICGIANVDLGCHQIGVDPKLKEFLEIYSGCSLVSLDHPLDENGVLTGNGFYFSKGCYELISHLIHWIEKIGIPLLFNHRIDSIFVDTVQEHAVVKTNGISFSTKKVFYTRTSSFSIENAQISSCPRPIKYPHLYLLIQDPTPPKFSYMGYGSLGASRAMNLTYFVGMSNTGRQLLAIQVSKEAMFHNAMEYLEDLKMRHLIDPAAYLLKAEGYTYETIQNNLKIEPEFRPYFEKLETGTLLVMRNSISKWSEILRPYQE